MPLTDIQVKSFKPLDKQYKRTDGDGMHLLIKPNGGKYWQFSFSFNGIRKTISFGTYPEVSLSEARNRRHDARKSLQRGENPSSERKQAKLQAAVAASNTLEAVALDWMEQQRPRWDAVHAEKIEARLRKHSSCFNEYFVG